MADARAEEETIVFFFFLIMYNQQFQHDPLG